MKLAEIPVEKVRTGFAYLKGEAGGRPSRRRPEEIEEPVTVIESGRFFEIVDGFKRLAALERAGAKTVPAVIQDWKPMKAKAMMLSLNARRRTLSPWPNPRRRSPWRSHSLRGRRKGSCGNPASTWLRPRRP